MSKVNIWVRPARPAVAVPNVKIIDMGFDPTSLSLTGFWRASYSGAPWVPTASAGTSGANGNLVAGPPAANAVAQWAVG